MIPMIRRSLVLLTLLSGLVGCAAKPYDYTNFRAHQPRSILVLPPLNDSTDIKGTYSYLSTVTRPLAERGYYVFPVSVIDQYLKANGMPTAGEMRQVPLSKVAEIIGADAVLYVTLEQYGSKYQILSSTAVVSAKASLVDTRTQTVLWEGTATAQSANNGSGNPIADLIAAAVTQAINSKADTAHGVCRLTNAQLFDSPDRGLLYGPYSPKYKSD